VETFKKYLGWVLAAPFGLWLGFVRAPYLFSQGFTSFPSVLEISLSRFTFWLVFVAMSAVGGWLAVELLRNAKPKWFTFLVVSSLVCSILTIRLFNQNRGGFPLIILAFLGLIGILPLALALMKQSSTLGYLRYGLAFAASLILGMVSYSCSLTLRLPFWLGGTQLKTVNVFDPLPECGFPNPMLSTVTVYLEENGKAWVSYRESATQAAKKEVPSSCLRNARSVSGEYQFLNRQWVIKQ
jgi:hypothetical protein